MPLFDIVAFLHKKIIMKKVDFFDSRIRKKFLESTSALSTILSLVLIFCEIPDKHKIQSGFIFLLLLFFYYVYIWWSSNHLNEIEIEVESSKICIKSGDIFKQAGFKVIAFNEYFDTQVDDKVIAYKSLNGVYLKQHLIEPIETLDEYISNYDFDEGEVLEINDLRRSGKKQKYKIGTVCVYNDYIFTAFSKFDSQNKAYLTMPEYLGFLICFWDKVNQVYGQESVSVPIFGSGITRIKEHRRISDEDLLKIMLWTFRISEMRFKYPAKLTIVIHKDKINKINLLDIEAVKEGI
ncbi:hypothetical protein D3C77_17050 [compost metagenome]